MRCARRARVASELGARNPAYVLGSRLPEDLASCPPAGRRLPCGRMIEGTLTSQERTLEGSKPAASRIDCLDGLRGVAVLMVLVFHGVLPGLGAEQDRAVRLAAFG